MFTRYGVLVDPKILLVFLEDPYSWPSASLIICKQILRTFIVFTRESTIIQKLCSCMLS